MRLHILFYVSILVFTSCDESIEGQLDNASAQIVINGWITDGPGPHRVRITRIIPFTAVERNPGVLGASVFIESLGEETPHFLKSSPDSLGTYITDSLYVGVPGRIYRLNVLLSDGLLYQSQWELMRTSGSLRGLKFEKRRSLSGQELEDYVISGLITDPKGIRNFYRWKIWVNQEELLTVENMILFSDQSEPINGRSKYVDVTSYFFDLGDSVTIQQLSLSERSYNYLRLIKNQANALGNANSTSPAILTSNIFNVTNPEEVVLGHFGASALEQAHAIIE